MGKRPRLAACLEYVREGDTLVVTRLDRLARSTLHLCQIAEELMRKQVHLQVLDQHIHTNDATGRLLFHMLGAIAQFETEARNAHSDVDEDLPNLKSNRLSLSRGNASQSTRRAFRIRIMHLFGGICKNPPNASVSQG